MLDPALDLDLGPVQTLVLVALIGLNKEVTIQQLQQRLEQRRMPDVARGGLYRTLVRLEELGFVESRFEPHRTGQAGRPRKLIRPTELGLVKLTELRRTLQTVTALAQSEPWDGKKQWS